MGEDLLLKEIKEQPLIIEKLVNKERNIIREIAFKLAGKFNYVIMAARGSSDNAARYAQYLFGVQNLIQVALATPSLFTLYKRPPKMTGALVIGISQSGQSPDIVEVLIEAQKQGCPTLSLTNDLKSPLANASDFLIPLHLGIEKSIAATKSFSSSLTSLALLASFLNSNKKHLVELERLPEQVNATLIDTLNHINDVQRYRYINDLAVIGRGFNYSTAFEISLKVKELARIIAIPYSSADYKHGPIATVKQGFPMVVISPKGKVNNDLFLFSKQVKTLGAELIMISNSSDHLKMGTLPFKVADSPEWLSPIVCTLPGQLFARQLALEKGLNPNKPQGLTKVTETY
jgi:glucosamine--fructose-6-phosphate aminotransferase (isomerizing)